MSHDKSKPEVSSHHHPTAHLPFLPNWPDHSPARFLEKKLDGHKTQDMAAKPPTSYFSHQDIVEHIDSMLRIVKEAKEWLGKASDLYAFSPFRLMPI